MDANPIKFTVPLPQTPNSDLPVVEGLIEDVGKSTKDYIEKHYRNQAIAAIIITVALEAALLYLLIQSGEMDIAQVMIFPVGGLFALYGYVRGKISHVFMQQFALLNDYAYQKTGPLDGRDGSLFQAGHGKSVQDVVSGTFQGCPLELFNYNFTVGYGKSSHTYFLTIFQVHYHSALPRMFLDAKHGIFGDPTYSSFPDSEELKLEGDFNKHFKLTVAKKFEIEALQIFTPDFMARMQDCWSQFDLEFVGEHLYLYHHALITTRQELVEMYELARYVISKLQPKLEYISEDVEALSEYMKK